MVTSMDFSLGSAWQSIRMQCIWERHIAVIYKIATVCLQKGIDADRKAALHEKGNCERKNVAEKRIGKNWKNDYFSLKTQVNAH